MEIKASDVKALRDKTGAGMMECKKALVDSNGDPAAAEKLLKEKGLAAVAKRSDRAAGEGRIFVKQDGNRIAIVEMTCETDFVAKNDDFIALGEKLVSITLEKNYNEVYNFFKSKINTKEECLVKAFFFLLTINYFFITIIKLILRTPS